jgi:hypothetical protein
MTTETLPWLVLAVLAWVTYPLPRYLLTRYTERQHRRAYLRHKRSLEA